MSLLIFHSHYDSLLHLTKDRYQDSVAKLAVVTVSFLVMFPSVDMNHPAIQKALQENYSLLTYLGGLPSAMAFLPRAELSTTFILVVFITPQVCQIWWIRCLQRGNITISP